MDVICSASHIGGDGVLFPPRPERMMLRPIFFNVANDQRAILSRALLTSRMITFGICLYEILAGSGEALWLCVISVILA